MELEIRTGLLKDFVRAIRALSDEARLCFDETGMWTRAVDPAHVSLLKGKLEKVAFDRFEFTTNERDRLPIQVPIDLQALNDFLAILKPCDWLRLTHRDESVIIDVDDLRRRIKVDDDWVELPVDAVANAKKGYTHIFNVEKEHLSRILKAMELTSDWLCIMGDDEGIRIMDNTWSGEMRTWTRIPGDFRLDGELKLPTTSKFPIDYFKSLVQSVSSDTVRLSLGQDHPIEIDWNIENAEKKVGNITYLLAPRIID